MSYLWMQCKLAHAAATDAMCGCCCIERQLLWYIVAVSCRRKAGLVLHYGAAIHFSYISATLYAVVAASLLARCSRADSRCIDQVGVAEHAGG